MRRDVFQAIADPTRREIIHLLSEKSLNLNAVADKFTISRPAISKHIKILTECGLIEINQQGRERICEAKLEKLNEVSHWVEQYNSFWNQKLDALENYLNELQTKRKNMENLHDVMTPADNKLVISRLLNAPRELVWEAWTDPKHIIHWFGPNGFTNTFINCDTRSGGSWKFTMHGPDGSEYSNRIVFLEVVKPERLVYQHTGEDDTEDVKFSVTITFEPIGNKTEITMTSVFANAEELQRVIRDFGAKEGGIQTLRRLDDYVTILKTSPEGPIVIERTFNATPADVWNALTNKEEMKSWYFDLKEFKPELNFEFTFTGTSEDNTPYLHHCKITDVIPGKRLEYSWSYDGYPGISYVRFELYPEGNKTRLRLTHRGLETFPAHPDFARKNFFKGWTSILGESLMNYLENTKP